ncbi:hypothetical protein ZZ1p0200 [Acinetobacter phage ZZ1]|jgi:hypothetical protein|uniref:Uncharacterized protein n=1 Tax=Acinetobacter phage ZZ1 TaxID=1049283 RepID=I3WW68_9CAUD|nr:hypothetical protein ZZ1p0200 [Acinetobacter phage ZZ1]AFL47738.1 hypothetical protein ZZ1p0200 [Acinetobacter phage ZZ1]
MEQRICAVCKAPIDDALVIETEYGPVHPGHCYQHVTEMPFSESEQDNILAETELLL